MNDLRPTEPMPEAYYVRWEELNRRVRRRGGSPAAHAALAEHETLTRQQWHAQWAAELRQPPGRHRWIVQARRLPGSESVFLCVSPTQGSRMVPAAHSMAKRFANRTEAEAERREAQTRYHGLADWRLVQDPDGPVGNPTP